MRKRKLIIRVLSVCIVLTLCITCFSQTSEYNIKVEASTLSDLQAKKKANDAKLKQINQKISATKNDQAKEKEYQENVSEQITVTEENIRVILEEIDTLEKNIAALNESIAQQEADIQKGMDEFKERLRVMYMSGNDSMASVLAGSADFYDLLSRMEFVKRIAKSDDQMIDDLNDQLLKLNNDKAALEHILRQSVFRCGHLFSSIGNRGGRRSRRRRRRCGRRRRGRSRRRCGRRSRGRGRRGCRRCCGRRRRRRGRRGCGRRGRGRSRRRCGWLSRRRSCGCRRRRCGRLSRRRSRRSGRRRCGRLNRRRYGRLGRGHDADSGENVVLLRREYNPAQRKHNDNDQQQNDDADQASRFVALPVLLSTFFVARLVVKIIVFIFPDLTLHAALRGLAYLAAGLARLFPRLRLLRLEGIRIILADYRSLHVGASASSGRRRSVLLFVQFIHLISGNLRLGILYMMFLFFSIPFYRKGGNAATFSA